MIKKDSHFLIYAQSTKATFRGTGNMQEDREQVKAERNEAILDKQVGGDHYKDCKIQPVEYIHANGLDYFEGNVIKYVTRHRTKGEGKKDIEKAIHYAQLILELYYK